jgi:hypothetical protein
MKYVDPVWLDTCCKGGLSSGEGLAWEIRDAVMRTNKDGEEVQVVDPVLDKRLLAEEREFAQVLSVMRREGSTLSISLRTAWDSHPLNSLTKNSPAKCSEPHISVIGHITEQELRRALDDTSVANGFANRFLFACVTRSKFLPFGSKLDEEAIKAVAQKVLDVFHRFYVDEIEITMDEEASKLWGEVYRELSTGKPGMLGAIIARADAQTKRLALVYAVLDCSDTIKLPHLKAALAVTRYSEDSAAYIFGDALGDHVADEILRTIRATGKMSRTDINNLFARNLTAAKIGAALVTLLEHKRVQRVMQQQSGSKGGRPTEYWMSS